MGGSASALPSTFLFFRFDEQELRKSDFSMQSDIFESFLLDESCAELPSDASFDINIVFVLPNTAFSNKSDELPLRTIVLQSKTIAKSIGNFSQLP